METSLNTLKNLYAQEQGYEDWSSLCRESMSLIYDMELHMNEICIRAQKTALEKKIERMKSLRSVYDVGSGQHNILSMLIYEFETNPENLIR